MQTLKCFLAIVNILNVKRLGDDVQKLANVIFHAGKIHASEQDKGMIMV